MLSFLCFRNSIKRKGTSFNWNVSKSAKNSKLASQISEALPVDNCLTLVPKIFHWSLRKVTECSFIEKYCAALDRNSRLRSLYTALGFDSIWNVIWALKEMWPSWRDFEDWSLCVKCQSKQGTSATPSFPWKHICPNYNMYFPQFDICFIFIFVWYCICLICKMCELSKQGRI